MPAYFGLPAAARSLETHRPQPRTFQHATKAACGCADGAKEIFQITASSERPWHGRLRTLSQQKPFRMRHKANLQASSTGRFLVSKAMLIGTAAPSRMCNIKCLHLGHSSIRSALGALYLDVVVHCRNRALLSISCVVCLSSLARGSGLQPLRRHIGLWRADPPSLSPERNCSVGFHLKRLKDCSMVGQV